MRPRGCGPDTVPVRSAARMAGVFLLGLCLLAFAACTPMYRDHGYAPTDAELKAVVVGKDTRETVTAAVGRPSASGVLGDSRWYYVQSRYRQRGIYADQEVERQVVVITFAESGTVANIERFGLEDGKVVALSRRVTDSNIEGISFLGQLLGNFGRLTGQQLLPGAGQQ